MRRSLAVAIAAGLALVLASGASAESKRLAYVAYSYTDTGLDYVPRQAGVSTMGRIEFTPSAGTVTITIQDVAAGTGQTVPVIGLPGVARGRSTCLPVGTKVSLRGFTPGRVTTLRILGDLAWWGVLPDTGCTGHSVAGTVELQL